MATAQMTPAEMAEAAKAAAEKIAQEKAAAEAAAIAEAAEAAAAAAKLKPETLRVRPAFGDMRNPFTGQHLPQGDSKKVIVDAWILAQIEGGKLVLSDD